MRTSRTEREILAIETKFPGAAPIDEPDGGIRLIIPAYPVPPGFSATSARVAVLIPSLFPAEKLDLFWLDSQLRRLDGAVLPNIMIPDITLAGQSWSQISWHDNAAHDPERISVLGFVRSIGSWFTGQMGT